VRQQGEWARRWTYPIKSLDILGDVLNLAKVSISTRFSQREERQASLVGDGDRRTDGRTDRHETDGSHKERYIEVEQDSAKRTGREQ